MKKRLLALGLAFVLCLGALPEALASGQPFTNKDQALDLAVDSLMDAVFAAEYANDQGGYMVRWASPLRVFAGGEYTQQDLDTLNSFINELSNRVIWLPDISMVYDVSQSNVTFAFAPLNDMAGFDMPGYVEGD